MEPTFKVDRNTLGLGWWIPSDCQHPDFVEQPRPSSQLATVQLESTHTSGTQTPAHEEFLSTALQEVARMAGSQTLCYGQSP
jgi:hypothetical protein